MRDRISLALVCLMALIGADQSRPAPRFAGNSIPDPPKQGKPWTPPATKLPRFLTTAAGLLFDEGVGDPRGCEYRDVEVGEGRSIWTRGWVPPERPGDTQRFAVGWNGVIYPAIAVGAKADLDADVRALAAPKPEPENHFLKKKIYGDPSTGPALETPSRLKIVMLLRLGRADLAESLFAAWTVWKPDRAGRDLTDYGVSYLTLAREWAATMHGRLISAHVEGDDAVALDAARRLSAFARSAEAKAEELGFQRPDPPYGHAGPGSYFQLRQLAELLADQERRAAMPPRLPIPARGTDPKERIAAMIRDLDQIHVVQMSSPGSAHPGGHASVKELIREGEPAVEPLLAALEADTRLTRSASQQRGGPGYSHVHAVYEAELAALDGLIPTAAREHRDLRDKLPASRKELARALRSAWERARGGRGND